jgi:transposase
MPPIDLKSLPVGEINAALAREIPPWARKRLIAVRAVIEGRSLNAAARAAGAAPTSVGNWLRALQRQGCAALLRDARLARPYPLRMTAQQIAATLQEIGSTLMQKQPPRVRKRLIALRALLSGRSLAAAARAVLAKPHSVREWHRRLQRGGCPALLHNACKERPYPLRMTAKQIAAARKEIETALAQEQPPEVCKRLVALRALLSGQSLAAAARAAHANPNNLRKWHRRLRHGGCSTLLREPQIEHPYPLHMTERQIATARQEIEAALADQPSPWSRKRLISIRAVIEGQSLASAARAAGVSPTSVSNWLHKLQQDGCAALLRGPPEPRRAPLMTPEEIASTLPQVEAALAREHSPQIHKRLIAIRAILSGETTAAAARLAHAARTSVRAWRRKFRQHGCAALMRDSRTRHARPLPMTPGQIAAAQQEIEAALAHDRPPRYRKRLLALRALLSGQIQSAAARAAGATDASVGRWLKRVQQGGCANLLRKDRRNRARKPLMTPEQTADARQEIEAALARPFGRPLRERLTALQLALAGQIHDAAKRANVEPVTISSWLRQIRDHGVTQFLNQRRNTIGCNFQADLAQLHALAGAEKNPNIRKRILALAYVAAGVPVYDAAIAARLAPATVYTAIRRFQREGTAAFRNKSPLGPRVRLSLDQLQAVAGWAREDPEMTPDQLCARILAAFGVRYTVRGLLNMLKNQLGIHLTPTTSRRLPSHAPPSSHPQEHRNSPRHAPRPRVSSPP